MKVSSISVALMWSIRLAAALSLDGSDLFAPNAPASLPSTVFLYWLFPAGTCAFSFLKSWPGVSALARRVIGSNPLNDGLCFQTIFQKRSFRKFNTAPSLLPRASTSRRAARAGLWESSHRRPRPRRHAALGPSHSGAGANARRRKDGSRADRRRHSSPRRGHLP